MTKNNITSQITDIPTDAGDEATNFSLGKRGASIKKFLQAEFTRAKSSGPSYSSRVAGIIPSSNGRLAKQVEERRAYKRSVLQNLETIAALKNKISNLEDALKDDIGNLADRITSLESKHTN